MATLHLTRGNVKQGITLLLVPSNLLDLLTKHQITIQARKIIWDTLPTPSHLATKAVSGKMKRRAKCGDMSKHMHWETGVDAKQT